MAGLSRFTEDNTAVSSPFHLQRLGLCAGLMRHKGSRYAFLSVQGSSAAVIYNSSISQAGETLACVSVCSKLLLGLVIDVLLIVE